MKSREIATLAEAQALESRLAEAAAVAVARLADLVQEKEPLVVLEALKFDRLGRDPLDPSRPLNLVEQINQTFTYLVSLRAVEFLFEEHPEAAPYRLNLGTASGTDVESVDGSVAAEVFAAVTPSNNRKLAKDVVKVERTSAVHKYVFFHCPGEFDLAPREDVRVIHLSLGLDRQFDSNPGTA